MVKATPTASYELSDNKASGLLAPAAATENKTPEEEEKIIIPLPRDACTELGTRTGCNAFDLPRVHLATNPQMHP